MSFVQLAVLSVLIVSFSQVRAKLREGDCEVCVQFLGNFQRHLKENDIGSNLDKIEIALLKYCKQAKGKDERFCYYIGATDISATKLIHSVTKPLSFFKPVEKICEDLKKKDTQICDLKYEKQIDLETVDLKKLRVKELKKILSQWGEDCRGCVEKTEFIDKINVVKIKHVEL